MCSSSRNIEDAVFGRGSLLQNNPRSSEPLRTCAVPARDTQPHRLYSKFSFRPLARPDQVIGMRDQDSVAAPSDTGAGGRSGGNRGMVVVGFAVAAVAADSSPPEQLCRSNGRPSSGTVPARSSSTIPSLAITFSRTKNILDGLGHISVRHDQNPDHFLSRDAARPRS